MSVRHSGRGGVSFFVVLYEEGDRGFVSSNSSLALPTEHIAFLRLVYALSFSHGSDL